ncbi:hypothetical protein BCR44DRAFT_67110 [Catenaria anguillulae PL171]|uniref:Uncharacterized protein n=1 Tax=Catenaria anguillulae PL171 TaxID=765915 RepID=A0A1Y2I2L9_9FUNG|nr:hypothetical protein BCR44DRAFT_67110 [Catenaria anguillulae PL171]
MSGGSSTFADILATPAIWPPLIAAVESLDSATNHRLGQLTLARLAWTCRAAYTAIHLRLWSTLRLVFRDRGERPPSPSSSKDSAAAESLLARHAQVMDGSLFPHYNPSMTSATTAGCRDARAKVLIQRTRAVSEFRYLYPFVVLGGKLYLAILYDKKKHTKPNGSAPSPAPARAGVWGKHVLPKSGLPLETRVIGGLLLVEYPLRLVTRIVVDFSDPSFARRFECDHLNCKTDLTAKLSFLLSPYFVNQVTSFDFLAVNPRHCLGMLHHKLSHAYTNVQSHDWAIRRGGLRPTPTVVASASHVRLLIDHSFNAAHPLRAVGMPDSQITHFELYGAGVFHFCWPRSQVFKSKSLSMLVLDFDVDFANGCTHVDQGHVAYRWSMPALCRFKLTTSVANLLFPNDSSHYRPGEPITSECAFPQLTHLTLIPKHTRHEALNQAPELPYTHMPNLTHFAVPFPKTAARNNIKRKKIKQSNGHFTLPVMDLYKLLTHAKHLTSLDLAGVAQLCPTYSSALDPTPVHLTKASLRASHLRSVSHAFSIPGLASLVLVLDTADWTRELLKIAPNTMARLTLKLNHGPIQLGSDVWLAIAKGFPTLTHLDIRPCDLAFDSPSKHARDSVIDLMDASHDLLDIEDLSINAIATEEQEQQHDSTAHPFTMPHITHLAITHLYAHMPPHLTLPNLVSLETHMDRLNLLTAALSHLARLVLYGKLSAVAAQNIFNLVPPSAAIHFVPLGRVHDMRSPVSATKPRDKDAGGPLVFKFAGAQHARTWSKVLRACKWSAPTGTVGRHTGKRAVTVVLGAGVEEKHARLIGHVVCSLLGGNLGRVDVVWEGEVADSSADICVQWVREAVGGAQRDGKGVRLVCEE